MLWPFLSVALAADPSPLVAVPIAVPVGTEQNYEDWLVREGKPVQKLSCFDAIPETASICMKLEERGFRRFVVEQDLQERSLGKNQLRAMMAEQFQERLGAALSVSTIRGYSDKQYWSWTSPSTWPSGALLFPELVASQMKKVDIMLALPSPTVLLAWPAGDDEINMVMAVAVAEIYQAEDGYSPIVFQFKAGKITPMFTAIKPGDGSSPLP